MTFVAVPDKDVPQLIEDVKKNLCVSCRTWVGVERVAEGDFYCHKCDDEMPEPELELGQPVRYEHSVVRSYSRPGQFLGPNRIWTSVLISDGRGVDQRTPAGQGIVIGKRTVSDGNSNWQGEESGYDYTPAHHFTVWLVAYDLRRKPVHVLSRHIEALPVQLELSQ